MDKIQMDPGVRRRLQLCYRQVLDAKNGQIYHIDESNLGLVDPKLLNSILLFA